MAGRLVDAGVGDAATVVGGVFVVEESRCTCSNARACNGIDTYDVERLVIRGSSCTTVNLVRYDRK